MDRKRRRCFSNDQQSSQHRILRLAVRKKLFPAVTAEIFLDRLHRAENIEQVSSLWQNRS